MQMSRLEVERNDLKIKLLEHRKNTLDIRTAVPGVVLRGDLDEVQNAPVEAGQTLFEIAPLDQLRLEIRIPEHDVTYVSPGMEVSVYLDALAEQKLLGTVTRVHPQAEVTDSQNGFIAEVELANVPAVLRPGMHGDAKVIAGRRSLGWVYFHRPWQRLVNFLR
jgi:multidrug efflux pump subunit AcrA (membrane-fusion protein)